MISERVIVYLFMESDRFNLGISAAEKRLAAMATVAVAQLSSLSLQLSAQYEANLAGFSTIAQSYGTKYKGIMSNVYGQMQLVGKEMDRLRSSDTLGKLTAEDYTQATDKIRGSLESLTAQYKVTREQTKDLGKQLLDDITSLAVATPFATEELIAAGRTLAGYGVEFDNILPTLHAIGEVTSAVGGDLVKLQRISLAYGQVISKNKFYAQELRQFTESGVGAQHFAEALGLSVKEFLALMEAGQIGSDVVVKAFKRMTEEGGAFHGMMKELQKSPIGRMNALVESLQIQLREVGRGAWQGIEESGFWGEVGVMLDKMKKAGPEFKENIRVAFTHSRETLIGLSELTSNIAEQSLRAAQSVKEIGIMMGADTWFPESWKDFMASVASFPYALEESWLVFRKNFVMLNGEGLLKNALIGLRIITRIIDELYIGITWGIEGIMMPRLSKAIVGLINKTIILMNAVRPLGFPAFPVLPKKQTEDFLNGMKLGGASNYLEYREKMFADEATNLSNLFNKFVVKGGGGLIDDLLKSFGIEPETDADMEKKMKDAAEKTYKAYQKAMDRMNAKPPDFDLGFDAGKMSIPKTLLDPKMMDYVNKIKTDFNDSKGAVVGLGQSINDLSKRFDALRIAADPIKFAWKDTFAEMTKDVRVFLETVTKGPGGNSIENTISGLTGGIFSATELMKSFHIDFEEMKASTPAFIQRIEMENGISVLKTYPNAKPEMLTESFFSVGKALSKMGTYLEPVIHAMNSSDYMDREGNIGMNAIVENLKKLNPGLSGQGLSNRIQEMIANGEIKVQGYLSDAQKAFGAGQLYDALKKRMGSSDELYMKALETFPTPAYRGSVEAQDAINRHQYIPEQNRSLQDEIVSLLELLKNAETSQKERDIKILNALEKIAGNKTLLEVVNGPRPGS